MTSKQRGKPHSRRRKSGAPPRALTDGEGQGQWKGKAKSLSEGAELTEVALWKVKSCCLEQSERSSGRGETTSTTLFLGTLQKLHEGADRVPAGLQEDSREDGRTY